MGAGKVDWGWGNGLRTEIESACDYNGINERNGTPGPERSTGDQGTQGVFGNVFYDLSPPKVGIPVRGIEPHAGLGAGVLWTHSSPITSVAEDGNVFRLGDTGENFAYQAVIGVGIPPGMPGSKLGIDWRFIGIDVRSGAVGTSYSPAGVRGERSTCRRPSCIRRSGSATPSNTLLRHGCPFPWPPSYLAFFDRDRWELTPRALDIVVAASTRVGISTIEVDGHADTSHAGGAAAGRKYDLALSRRRGSAVSSDLARDGVPRDVVGIRALDDTVPLVPTGPNAREPQNRRVEILLRRQRGPKPRDGRRKSGDAALHQVTSSCLHPVETRTARGSFGTDRGA